MEKNAAFPGSIGGVARPIVPAAQAVRSRWGDLFGNAMRVEAGSTTAASTRRPSGPPRPLIHSTIISTVSRNWRGE